MSLKDDTNQDRSPYGLRTCIRRGNAVSKPFRRKGSQWHQI